MQEALLIIIKKYLMNLKGMRLSQIIEVNQQQSNQQTKILPMYKQSNQPYFDKLLDGSNSDQRSISEILLLNKDKLSSQNIIAKKATQSNESRNLSGKTTMDKINNLKCELDSIDVEIQNKRDQEVQIRDGIFQLLLKKTQMLEERSKLLQEICLSSSDKQNDARKESLYQDQLSKQQVQIQPQQPCLESQQSSSFSKIVESKIKQKLSQEAYRKRKMKYKEVLKAWKQGVVKNYYSLGKMFHINHTTAKRWVYQIRLLNPKFIEKMSKDHEQDDQQ